MADRNLPTHLLIVEDHEENRNLLKVLLEANGYRVTAAGDGLEALAAARRDRPDAIVSDALMPKMDGFELCRQWTQDTGLKTIPFIFYSATYVRPENEQFAVALGAARYLIKPLEAAVFLRELRAVLQECGGHATPGPASLLGETASRALHEAALARKLEDKIAQLEVANRKLQESEARFRKLVEMSSDFYWESDAEHRITQRTAGRDSGAPSAFCQGAQIGKRRWEVPYLSPDEAGWRAHRAVLEAHRPFRNFELSRAAADGTQYFRSISGDPVFDAAGVFKGYRGIGTDITERKRVEESLRESEQELRAIFDGALDGILVADADTRKLLTANDAICAMLGYTREEIVGIGVWDIHPKQHFARVIEQFEGLLRGENNMAADVPVLRKDGSVFYADIKASPIHLGGKNCLLGIFRDITARKLTEEALKRESRQNQIFLRNASDGVHILDDDGNVLQVSDSFCAMLGYSRDELIGANVSLWDAQWSPHELKQLIAEQIAKKSHSVLQTRHRRRDGSFLDVEVTGQGLELDGEPVLFNSARDITERILAEQKLVEGEAQFRALVEQSIAGAYIIQDGQFAYVNARCAEIFGYRSADELVGRDASSVVAEKDRSAVADNIRQRINGTAATINYEFSGLRKDGSMIDVDVHGARATHRGRAAVVGLIQDVSERKRAEAEIQRYITQLESAFMSSVEVAKTLSEMRDPYTAGHEQRVAEIAVAIGAELGFDKYRQEGLRVAGYLHDVGKMIIPTEILSKPGKLSAIEYELIKGHVEAGYSVLKDVQLPWPVAQVALQHHERMDGSGYPHGLKGEAILLEARIMAVADVVEAMSSHRPYRPGLGIDKALAEIERGRGTAYDADAADACLRLFREKCYQLLPA